MTERIKNSLKRRALLQACFVAALSNQCSLAFDMLLDYPGATLVSGAGADLKDGAIDNDNLGTGISIPDSNHA